MQLHDVTLGQHAMMGVSMETPTFHSDIVAECHDQVAAWSVASTRVMRLIWQTSYSLLAYLLSL